MAVYEYRCAEHGRFDVQRPMSEYGEPSPCPDCEASCERIISLPYFTEDRSRLYRNNLDGTRKSYVTGYDMPDTRREFETQLASIGAEVVTPSTEPVQWKEGREYAKHVATGGERVKEFEKARHPDSKKGSLTVTEQLRKSGIRIG